MTQFCNHRAHATPPGRTPWRYRPIFFPALAGRIAGLVLVLSAGMLGVAGPGFDALAEAGDVTVLLRRAEGGDARSAFVLGMRYARPDDSSRDDVEAVRWLRQAAEQGLAEAQYNLGIMYASGRGVARDSQQAARWYREAAEQGLASAQYNLGAQYAVGDGVSRDAQRAAMWFERAALQDVPEAAYNLGVLYDLGRGVEADARTAMQWYERAAERGYHPAASRLAALRAANPSIASPASTPSPTAEPAGKASDAASVKSTAEPAATSAASVSTASAVEPDSASAASSSSAGVDARSASAWLARFDPTHYTLQVLSHTNEASVRRYLEENFKDGEAGYFAFELDGTTWYSVVYGDYASYSQATVAGKGLADRLGGTEPWVRKLAIIQKAAIR